MPPETVRCVWGLLSQFPCATIAELAQRANLRPSVLLATFDQLERLGYIARDVRAPAGVCVRIPLITNERR